MLPLYLTILHNNTGKECDKLMMFFFTSNKTLNATKQVSGQREISF